MVWAVWYDFSNLPGHQVNQLVNQEWWRNSLHSPCRNLDELSAYGTSEPKLSRICCHNSLEALDTHSVGAGKKFWTMLSSIEHAWRRRMMLFLKLTISDLTQASWAGEERFIEVFIVNRDCLDQGAANRVSKFSPDSPTSDFIQYLNILFLTRHG